ncbi:MAG: hypothetical protein JWR77_2016 [Rhizorhabdus sp.]|nr:hypothetical protein [Rhizorhabdus sp.]
MGILRAFFRRHAALALLIVVMAIGLRAVMPAGYMANVSAQGITVELCSGVAGQTMTISLPGVHRSGDTDKSHADSPCAFAGLGLATLPAIDPFVLAIAIAFVMAAIFRVALPPVDAPAFLRPPLRGPPARI